MKTNAAGFVPLIMTFCLSITSIVANSTPAVTGDTSLTLFKSETRGSYLRLNEINIHAARDFAKRFRDVSDDKWLKADGGFLARFTVDNLRNDAYYDERGRFIASCSYYGDQTAPADIRELIRKEYPDYRIIAVTRITTPERSFYRLHISNPAFVKTLQVINTRIQVLETLQNIAANF